MFFLRAHYLGGAQDHQPHPLGHERADVEILSGSTSQEIAAWGQPTRLSIDPDQGAEDPKDGNLIGFVSMIYVSDSGAFYH